jgi:hypothetical protein
LQYKGTLLINVALKEFKQCFTWNEIFGEVGWFFACLGFFLLALLGCELMLARQVPLLPEPPHQP